MSEAALKELVERVARAQQEVLAQLEATPPEALYTRPREGEWSVMEVVAHVVEFQPTWAAKLRQIVEEEEPTVGRTPQEWEQRLSQIAAHAHDSPQEARRRLEEANRFALEALKALPPHGLERTCYRGDGTRLTLLQYVDHFIAHHLEEHARQIAQTRQALSEGQRGQ